MASRQVLKQKKKKKWFPIYSPKTFNNQLIGESYVLESSAMDGKFMKVNLSSLTKNMKKQNVSLRLRVNQVSDNKAYTEIIGMHIVQGFVKRLVRRGRSKIDDSFLAKSKEGALIRVKPLVITTNNCVQSTSKQLRAMTKEFLRERISSQPFTTTVEGIFSYKLQKELKEKLTKVFPIRSVDIRVFEREPVRGIIPKLAVSEEAPEAEETSEDVKSEEKSAVKEEETPKAEKEATSEEAPKAEEKSEDAKE